MFFWQKSALFSISRITQKKNSQLRIIVKAVKGTSSLSKWHRKNFDGELFVAFRGRESWCVRCGKAALTVIKKGRQCQSYFFRGCTIKKSTEVLSKLLEAFISIVSFFFLMWYSRLGNHANTPADKSKLELSS